MIKINGKCECEASFKPKNPPKKCFVIRRTGGEFSNTEIYFTEEGARRKVARDRKFYDEHIVNIQLGRTYDRENYLVECEIVEKKILE